MEMLIKNTANILDQYDQPLTDYFKDLSRRTGLIIKQEIKNMIF